MPNKLLLKWKDPSGSFFVKSFFLLKRLFYLYNVNLINKKNKNKRNF
jgi:hypothetical protein